MTCADLHPIHMGAARLRSTTGVSDPWRYYVITGSYVTNGRTRVANDVD